MSEKFEAWAVLEQGGSFTNFSYTPKTRGENDVDITIECCGMCASDIHQVDSGWFPSIYPIVPGHEIIGRISSVGNQVTRFAIGDRVGVGAQCFSCSKCDACNEKEENYCPKRVFTYNSRYEDGTVTYGGYAKSIRLHENFVVGIPDGLDSRAAAPLLCAGVTVYDPLTRWNIVGKKVAVLGVGGLGHLGVKFSVALGAAETVGISRSANKRDEVLALGANDYIATSVEGQLEEYYGYFDFILCTVNEPAVWDKYLRLLKRGGIINFVGNPDGEFNVPARPLIDWRIIFTGTVIGSPSKIEEMLALCVQRNILADVQVYPIDQVNKAFEDFRAGLPRFRYVLQIQDV